jgi:cobyrinic acid a,c-diamide synthase
VTRGLIIAAPASGQGKTTIALALMRALAARGLRVAPMKVGPDYIDPQFHALAAGRDSINLDPWAMRAATRTALLAEATRDADLALAEGVMGLFDGIDALGTASTASLALELGWPVVLVVDARGMAASVAPLVQGFARHRAGLAIAGVILNRVGGASHAATLRAALAHAVPEIPVLGAVPRDDSIVLGARHLGLVPAGEVEAAETIVAAAARLVATHVDLDALRALALPLRAQDADAVADPLLAPLGQRIAIARDDAFVFAYPAQLAAWRRAGAELAFFAPLDDEAPGPDCDAVFMPGGYPELHAGSLAAAGRFKAGMRMAATRGAAIYGECGGYMTLGAGLVDALGRRHAMLDLLPLETSFAERRLHLGYREVTLLADGPLGARGARLAGHEFHYATILAEGDGAAPFEVAAADGRRLGTAGRMRAGVTGSFIHLVDRR